MMRGCGRHSKDRVDVRYRQVSVEHGGAVKTCRHCGHGKPRMTGPWLCYTGKPEREQRPRCSRGRGLTSPGSCHESAGQINPVGLCTEKISHLVGHLDYGSCRVIG